MDFDLTLADATAEEASSGVIYGTVPRQLPMLAAMDGDFNGDGRQDPVITYAGAAGKEMLIVTSPIPEHTRS